LTDTELQWLRHATAVPAVARKKSLITMHKKNHSLLVHFYLPYIWAGLPFLCHWLEENSFRAKKMVKHIYFYTVEGVFLT